jgi:hypothetical protein
MSEVLKEKLAAFQQAQHDLFTHLGISRRLTNGETTEVPDLHYNHGSGNDDIPTPYPEVLDYRGRWVGMAARGARKAGDDEILIKIDDNGPQDLSNFIRFNILSHWGYDDQIDIVMGTHLPKPDELHYAQPDKVAIVEQGGIAWGDVCLLILDAPGSKARQAAKAAREAGA